MAAGLAACACGLVLGEADLLRVGVFLCALPLATAVVVARTRYRLSSSRRVEPPRVAVGENAEVVIKLENLSRVSTGVLLLEDRLPYSLGGRPRFVVGRIESLGVREVRYPVRSDVRGRYTVGPLSLRFADLFGLVELTRSFTSTDAVIVTPPVVTLPPVQLGGDWAGGGDSHSRSISTMGDDDVTTREYRHGDDLRRVHWRSTARYGELMVRREEQPWQNRGVLFLDTRIDAHRGDGPASSFEWAVAATASVGAHLARQGYGLRLVTDVGEDVSGYSFDAMTGTPFEGLLLDRLALVNASSGRDLTPGFTSIRRGGGEGLVIAVLGALTDADLEACARFRHHASACIAILLDAATWSSAPMTGRSHSEAHALLVSSGWRVIPAAARSDLRSLWSGASATSTFAAMR
ncbi:MAG: DUF58 domain-containing protein [Acidothermaceae bacterium]